MVVLQQILKCLKNKILLQGSIDKNNNALNQVFLFLTAKIENHLTC